MKSPEKYLKPEVIRQISRLDLRARFIVEGFLSGLHASPFQGFSVEFSEHRKYTPGDDIRDIDWKVYARTEKYYLKKFQAETNVTGYLALDLSASMGYTYRQELNKFEYATCLAAALAYLMVNQQDPVGLVTFSEKLQAHLAPRSKRAQFAAVISVLSNLVPAGSTDHGHCLHQLAALIRGKSLVMIFSDLLADPEPILNSIRHLRHRGHEIILFHILDEAETQFPFDGMIEFEDVETPQILTVDSRAMKKDYLQAVASFREKYKEECARIGCDYIAIDTSVNFDKALMEYLIQRQTRF
ncbi:MAG: DUF58 domain-containing protein [Gemmataceae bacterium]|nr:DUF58 domain-containing protein [Gemmataceae bacterium]